jgi:hypothetical protein
LSTKLRSPSTCDKVAGRKERERERERERGGEKESESDGKVL